jgi:imidazolonepropionase-like amidohydrolase
MTKATAGPLAIIGARVFDEHGDFVRRDQVTVADGKFTGTSSGPSTPSASLDATGMWLIPGVYDLHTHITWGDFHREDRERRTPEERFSQTTEALAATLRAGVTSMRDAGGADARLRDALSEGQLLGPRLQISIDMIGPAEAGTPTKMREAVERALGKGVQWIKLIATAGSTTPAASVLDSHFSKAEITAAVDTATQGGARVMVHTWGGDSADWAIEAGAASLEHGIYMDRDQIDRAADAGMTLVPTLTIYRHVRDMVVDGTLHGVPLERINDVIAVHENAVRMAYEVGLPLGIGSDYTTPWQHGTNLAEISALMNAGLSSRDALLAATRNGANLLGDAAGGVIAAGYRADAVVLTSDPEDPSTFESPANVRAVVKDGVIVHGSPAVTVPA